METICTCGLTLLQRFPFPWALPRVPTAAAELQRFPFPWALPWVPTAAAALYSQQCRSFPFFSCLQRFSSCFASSYRNPDGYEGGISMWFGLLAALNTFNELISQSPVYLLCRNDNLKLCLLLKELLLQMLIRFVF